MSGRAAVRRLPDHDDRPATVRDVRRLIDDALLSLVGEQREREQRRIDQTLDQIVRAATSAVRESIVDVVDRAAPRALSIPQVAEKCGVTPATVRRWIEEEGLPIVRTDAKRSLVPLFRLDEWLAARS